MRSAECAAGNDRAVDAARHRCEGIFYAGLVEVFFKLDAGLVGDGGIRVAVGLPAPGVSGFMLARWLVNKQTKLGLRAR